MVVRLGRIRQTGRLAGMGRGWCGPETRPGDYTTVLHRFAAIPKAVLEAYQTTRPACVFFHNLLDSDSLTLYNDA